MPPCVRSMHDFTDQAPWPRDAELHGQLLMSLRPVEFHRLERYRKPLKNKGLLEIL